MPSKSKPNKLKPGQPKPCGCEPKGLTRALALWECRGCGHVQRSPRSANARCGGCGRVKGPNPRGFGCCGQDWPEGQPCGECGRAADPCDVGSLPHSEVSYLTESCERGYFRARDSFLRCVGCLKLAPNGQD